MADSTWVGFEQEKNGTVRQVKYGYGNVPANSTDYQTSSGTAGYRLVIMSLFVMAGDTATDVTPRSKPSGAGADAYCKIRCGANGGVLKGHNKNGWFKTGVGEGIAWSTTDGSEVSVGYTYVEEKA